MSPSQQLHRSIPLERSGLVEIKDKKLLLPQSTYDSVLGRPRCYTRRRLGRELPVLLMFTDGILNGGSIARQPSLQTIASLLYDHVSHDSSRPITASDPFRDPTTSTSSAGRTTLSAAAVT
jgi:hypothetical protein